MIKSLHITNFQAHKDTYLELSPGVNIIIGPSDSGKTSIIRALRWLAFNRPQGDSFRSHWGGVCSIEAEFDDHSVIRKKDKVDEYILDEESYKAFRTEVPEEIMRALNMNGINIQLQLDSPFLLSETSGAVAQHFNKIAKLDKIDAGLYNVQSWIRQLTSDLKYKEGAIEKLQDDLIKFEYLPKLEVDIEVLEGLQEDYNTSIRQLSKLKSLISQIENKNIEIQEASVALEMEKEVTELLKLNSQLDTLVKQHEELSNIVEQIQDCEGLIEEGNELILAYPLVNTLINQYIKQNEIESVKIKLNKLLSNINKVSVQLNNEKQKYDSKLTEFNNNFPEVCPLCGQDYEKDKKHK